MDTQREEGAPAIEVAGTQHESALDEDMARLREYLERGDVDGAREYVKELHLRWPGSDRVSHFARVLAPPVARVVPNTGGRSSRDEHAWLREHAREYPGCWIAVLDQRLIAANPDVEVVLETVRQTPGAEGGLLHFQPRDAECR